MSLWDDLVQAGVQGVSFVPGECLSCDEPARLLERLLFLLYADDVYLLSRSLVELQFIMPVLSAKLLHIGLRLNAGKTLAISLGRSSPLIVDTDRFPCT